MHVSSIVGWWGECCDGCACSCRRNGRGAKIGGTGRERRRDKGWWERDALKMKIPFRRFSRAREEIFQEGNLVGPVFGAKTFRPAGGKYLRRPFHTKLVHKGIEGRFCKQLSHAAFSDSPRNCEQSLLCAAWISRWGRVFEGWWDMSSFGLSRIGCFVFLYYWGESEGIFFKFDSVLRKLRISFFSFFFVCDKIGGKNFFPSSRNRIFCARHTIQRRSINHSSF